MNNNEHNPYSELTNAQQIAVDMRLTGNSYIQIATHPFINLQEHTIRTWFMNNGVCHDALEWKKKMRSEEREEYYREVESAIKDIGRDAMFALREAINKGNVTAIVKGLEISGISRLTVQVKIEQADEGILLLRQIIEDGRKKAQEAHEQNPDNQIINNLTATS